MASSERDALFAEFEDAYAKEPDALLKQLKVDKSTGLSEEEAKKRLEKYGPNGFPSEAGTPLWMLILKQFEDTIVIILIVAAFVSFVLAFFEDNEEETLTAFVEPMVIIAILIANATMAVFQESSAEAAVEALKEYETEKASVIRGGFVKLIDAELLVPGDIVQLEVGNLVPADLRVLEIQGSSLDVAQALLTGESANVGKFVEAIKVADKSQVQIQDKTNMLFSGTVLTRGKTLAAVVGTGLNTAKGTIRKALTEESEEKFPLKEKLDEFGNFLSKAIGIICVVVWLINIPNFDDPAFGGTIKGAVYYFKIAVSLAVAAIPEGLPAVITTCLALGTQRMAKKNAIITALPAVETLGCTNVICSDKTGTLTTNQMAVQRFFVYSPSGLTDFAVEGNTFAPTQPDGSSWGFKFAYSSGEGLDLAAPLVGQSAAIKELSKVCSLCNDASISYNTETETYEKIGQSTEMAMKVLVEKLGPVDESLTKTIQGYNRAKRAMACNELWASQYKKIHTLEFNRQRKSMGVLVQGPNGSKDLLVKGAWDNVLDRCTNIMVGDKVEPLTAAKKAEIGERLNEYCGDDNCFRCLALAVLPKVDLTRESIDAKGVDKYHEIESKMTFVGVVGILDPPREEVKEAIKLCKVAGIDVIMITGDNVKTATAIARTIGLIGPKESAEGKAFTGVQFKNMSTEEKRKNILNAKIFARVEPIDKQDIVKCLHYHRKVVAMTGDGVNDAPALKEADIGIAMGSGTAVAKGAAKMILADDNFATIVEAVEEGRAIYTNTKQFIRYLICSNIGEVVAIFITAIFGLPEVLLPVQLLWVNLVTDGLPAVALGFNPPEAGIMQLDPRPRDEPIISSTTIVRYLVVGGYVGLATVGSMCWWYILCPSGPQLSYSLLMDWSHCSAHADAWQGFDCTVFRSNYPKTVALSVLVTIEMFCALNSISERTSLFSAKAHPLTNPYLLGAMSLSFSLHFVILYTPFLSKIFSVTPITFEDWVVVVLFSAPILLLDEVMKVVESIQTPLHAKQD